MTKSGGMHLYALHIKKRWLGTPKSDGVGKPTSVTSRYDMRKQSRLWLSLRKYFDNHLVKIYLLSNNVAT